MGEDRREKKREDLGGEKALRSQGGKGLRGERGERISTGKAGKTS